jgi:hypothetical protein
MNIPNRASRHHFIRASCSAFVSVEGTGGKASAAGAAGCADKVRRNANKTTRAGNARTADVFMEWSGTRNAAPGQPPIR